MNRFFVCLLLTACASTKPFVTQTSTAPQIAKDLWPETKALSAYVDDLKAPAELGAAESVTPLDAGKSAPFLGLFVTPAKGWRYGQYVIQYRDLYRRLELDSAQWTLHRRYYEDTILSLTKIVEQRQAVVESLQPTWWDRNSSSIAVGVGFFIGASLVAGVAIAYVGMNPATIVVNPVSP